MSSLARKVEIDLRILILATALVIIASVGSAFTAYLMINKANPATAIESGTRVKKADIGPTYDMGEFTVNIASTSNISSRFLRTGIVLELENKNLITEIDRRKPQIRDCIITILRSRTHEQLSSAHSLNSLKLDIIESINELVISGTVVDAFFVDLVIQ